jgi:hypothetical protein
LSIGVSAQSSIDYNIPNNKGKLYVFWGWNVSEYSNSNISFAGDDYNFSLGDVAATDRPTNFDPAIYFNPALITIPQTNFKFGYFITDHLNISLGVDHMKYVMVQNQPVIINGTINRVGSDFNGTYQNDEIVLTEDFLTFEHTDGLNYINVEIERFDDILKWFHKGNKNLEINLLEGFGVGALLPKTRSYFLGGELYDDFHLSGFGLNLKVGLNVTFFKYFFIQSEFKGGYINMPDIRYTHQSSDSASEAFTFWEGNFLFGVKFKVANRK